MPRKPRKPATGGASSTRQPQQPPVATTTTPTTTQQQRRAATLERVASTDSFEGRPPSQQERRASTAARAASTDTFSDGAASPSPRSRYQPSGYKGSMSDSDDEHTVRYEGTYQRELRAGGNPTVPSRRDGRRNGGTEPSPPVAVAAVASQAPSNSFNGDYHSNANSAQDNLAARKVEDSRADARRQTLTAQMQTSGMSQSAIAQNSQRMQADKAGHAHYRAKEVANAQARRATGLMNGSISRLRQAHVRLRNRKPATSSSDECN